MLQTLRNSNQAIKKIFLIKFFRSALAKMEVYCPETEDITKTNKTTTTTSIRTPTTSQDSELSELPRSAPSQSEADAEPGSAPTIGYSLTLFFLAITAHLFLYK